MVSKKAKVGGLHIPCQWLLASERETKGYAIVLGGGLPPAVLELVSLASSKLVVN